MAAIDDLPPLRDIVGRFGLAAKKSLGQNFLFDLNLTMRIARAAGDLSAITVVEIGPGPGGLTRALLAAGARRVVAIERDDRCLPALQMIAERYPGRLHIVSGDALEVDVPALLDGPAAIIANLPYNVATALLVAWLSVAAWPPWYKSLTLMFQREVADRLVAEPGSHAYGRLSVLTQWRCTVERLFDIAPSAFVPPPKVTSTVVHLVPRAEPLACDRRSLEQATAAAFGQRRKMLRSSLKSLGGSPELLLNDLSIDPTRRAETLTVPEFVAIANRIASSLDALAERPPPGHVIEAG